MHTSKLDGQWFIRPHVSSTELDKSTYQLC